MKTIPLTQGQVALVDDEDYELVSAYKWRASRNRRQFYACRTIRMPDGSRTVLYLHAFLSPFGFGPSVDHKDGNGLNCQRLNLRLATNTQNQRGFQHKRLNSTSGFRGVSWCAARQKWQVQVKKDKKSIYLGLFATEEEAARAYDSGALKHFKEFASLNFPL